MKIEGLLNIAIRRHIYAELQNFAQGTLNESVDKVVKNNNDIPAELVQFFVLLLARIVCQ